MIGYQSVFYLSECEEAIKSCAALPKSNIACGHIDVDVNGIGVKILEFIRGIVESAVNVCNVTGSISGRGECRVVKRACDDELSLSGNACERRGRGVICATQ